MRSLRAIIPLDEGKLRKALKNIKTKLKAEYAKEKEVFDNTVGEQVAIDSKGWFSSFRSKKSAPEPKKSVAPVETPSPAPVKSKTPKQKAEQTRDLRKTFHVEPGRTKKTGSFPHKEEVEIGEKRGTSSGQGILNRNFGAMKNIDLNKMVMDTLKRKVKDRSEAIAALHTLPIPQQNALDKNHYRLGEMHYDPFNWGLKHLDKSDKKEKPDPSRVKTPKNSVREYLKFLVSKEND